MLAMNNAIPLPEKPKDWTDEHANEALRRIADYEVAIKAAQARYDANLARIKDKFESEKQGYKAAIKALEKELNAAGKLLRKDWKNKSVALPWGTVRYYSNPQHLQLKPGKTAADAIAALKELGHADAVIMTETVSLEILEKKPAAVIAHVGYEWTKPKENFGYKTRLTIEAEEPKTKPKQED